MLQLVNFEINIKTFLFCAFVLILLPCVYVCVRACVPALVTENRCVSRVIFNFSHPQCQCSENLGGIILKIVKVYM